MFNDSMDKVVETYFAACTAIPFHYKNKEYKPRPLVVSPNFFHEYSCKLGCAGCCPRFSLDYLSPEPRPEGATHQRRQVTVGGVTRTVFSIMQKYPRDDGRRHCDNVNMETGACMIHGKQPFSCDFETLRFVSQPNHNWLGTRNFGRGWAMLRIDGERGALCEFPKQATEKARDEAIRKLKRLDLWMATFGLRANYIEHIVRWAEKGPHGSPQLFHATPSGTILSTTWK